MVSSRWGQSKRKGINMRACSAAQTALHSPRGRCTEPRPTSRRRHAEGGACKSAKDATARAPSGEEADQTSLAAIASGQPLPTNDAGLETSKQGSHIPPPQHALLSCPIVLHNPFQSHAWAAHTHLYAPTSAISRCLRCDQASLGSSPSARSMSSTMDRPQACRGYSVANPGTGMTTSKMLYFPLAMSSAVRARTLGWEQHWG